MPDPLLAKSAQCSWQAVFRLDLRRVATIDLAVRRSCRRTSVGYKPTVDRTGRRRFEGALPVWPEPVHNSHELRPVHIWGQAAGHEGGPGPTLLVKAVAQASTPSIRRPCLAASALGVAGKERNT